MEAGGIQLELYDESDVVYILGGKKRPASKPKRLRRNHDGAPNSETLRGGNLPCRDSIGCHPFLRGFTVFFVSVKGCGRGMNYKAQRMLEIHSQIALSFILHWVRVMKFEVQKDV